MKYLILPFLLLVGCVINVDSPDNVEAAEENLLTAQQILDYCNATCELPMLACSSFDHDNCIDRCLTISPTSDYTRRDIEIFDACIQCYIRIICTPDSYPDCYPHCLSTVLGPRSTCPNTDPGT